MSEVRFDRRPIIEGCDTPLPDWLEERIQWVEDRMDSWMGGVQ